MTVGQLIGLLRALPFDKPIYIDNDSEDFGQLAIETVTETCGSQLVVGYIITQCGPDDKTCIECWGLNEDHFPRCSKSKQVELPFQEMESD